MKHIRKFNEEINIFGKKKEKTSDLEPKGFKTIERPREEEVIKEIEPIKTKVDPYFLQEISDRLFGPDGEEYQNAIIELNKKFRPRAGRFGNQFYEPSKE